MHVAIVSNLPPSRLPGVPLAEIALAANKDVVLLERQEIGRILAEHHLSMAGMANAATAVQIGKLLSVNLLAVVEGNPDEKNAAALGLVVFDARTGARLADRAIGAEAKKMADGIQDAIRAAAAKYGLARKAVQTVTVVGVRDVDLARPRGLVHGRRQAIGTRSVRHAAGDGARPLVPGPCGEGTGDRLQDPGR